MSRSNSTQSPEVTTTTREIGSLEVRAVVAPDSLNKDKRTVDVVWTTGAKVLRGYWDKYWEEISLDPTHVRMGRLNGGGSPLLDAHQRWDLRTVIGVVESAKITGKEGRATVRFARAEDDPAADVIFRKVADGIIRNVSVGYQVFKYLKTEDVNEKIPTYRAVDWEPFEVSFVPVGADAGAGVRSAGGPEAPRTNVCEFVSFMEQSMSGNNSGGTAATPAATTTTTETTPAATAAREQQIREEAATLERTRIEGITTMVRTFKLDAAFGEDLIKRNVPIDEARRLAFEKVAARDAAAETETRGAQPTVVALPGGDAHEKRMAGMEAWLLHKGGQAIVQTARAFDKDVNLDPGEFRGMSALDMARELLEAAGVKTRGLGRMDLVAKAFTHTRDGAQGTSDFGTLLENVMHKRLVAAYAIAKDTWSKFCARSTNVDFRDSNRYRLGSLSVLDALNEFGEFRNKQIPDAEKATIRLATKGNIIALTRQVIVNDDLGAFIRLFDWMGRAAYRTVEKGVYDTLALNAGLGPLLSDGLTLFHATHGNITTGAVLSVNALDLDRVAMASQMDPSTNDYLDIRPAVIVLATALGGECRVIITSQYDPDTANKLQRGNKVYGLVSQDNIIDTPRLTGSTRRYLFADPSIAPVLEVAFLEGEENPVLESKDGWRVDGAELKVRHDHGIAGVDYRGAVTNAGQ